MLSDHERNTLLDVEGRFMVGYPELDRSFDDRASPTARPAHARPERQVIPPDTGDALLRVDQTRADG